MKTLDSSIAYWVEKYHRIVSEEYVHSHVDVLQYIVNNIKNVIHEHSKSPIQIEEECTHKKVNWFDQQASSEENNEVRKNLCSECNDFGKYYRDLTAEEQEDFDDLAILCTIDDNNYFAILPSGKKVVRAVRTEPVILPLSKKVERIKNEDVITVYDVVYPDEENIIYVHKSNIKTKKEAETIGYQFEHVTGSRWSIRERKIIKSE
jgi:DNA-directed RNA polymerase subunit M/transcription elongation factor TFIIS